MKSLLLFAICHVLAICCYAQDFYLGQYFEPVEDQYFDEIEIEISPDDNNLWQIGQPQKNVFYESSSIPNAIVTDTLLPYTSYANSEFSMRIPNEGWGWGILAVRWTQKLDMRPGLDGGKVEFSLDHGDTWTNIMSDPNVYDFYGYSPDNIGLLNDQEVFTGLDTNWRDIWLCFDSYWLSLLDSVDLRFTFMSDTVIFGAQGGGNDGWMLDDFLIGMTYAHTVAETEQKEYISVYPNPAIDKIHIELKKIQEAHIIEEMILRDSQGNIVNSWSMIPTKYYIDVSSCATGLYSLEIRSNIQTETVSVMISK